MTDVDADSRQPTPGAKAAAKLLDTAVKAVEAYGRPDLASRLETARARLVSPTTRVIVAGEFKQGKSSIVNALLNADVCAVDDDIATSVPTAVRHADPPAATAWLAPTLVGADDADAAEPIGQPIELAQRFDWTSEAGNPGNARGVRFVEVGIPRQLLADGLVLVDTPGVGGLGSLHASMTVAALASADAVLLVTDAAQELTEPELRFLGRARELCPTLACVLTKTDLYPAWRRIAKLDEAHLRDGGFAISLFPVSSALRQHAFATEDTALNTESGFPVLVRHLRDEVMARSSTLAVRALANDVLWITAQLRTRLEAERAALADPAAAEAIAAELRHTQDRAALLRGASARWQTTLNDGVTDLNADVDHDLRARTRQVLAESEVRIDGGDPAKWWAEFEGWIRQRLADDLTENYLLLTRRAEALAADVADHFAVAQLAITVPITALAPIETVAGLEGLALDTGERAKVGARGMTALRGSYGSFMMFGMFGGVVGVGAAHPAVLGLSVLTGAKAIRDELRRELTQRRTTAKTVVRKFIDEVNFQVGKDSRDATRRVHRQIRDTFQERAADLQRSASEAQQAAQQASQTTEAAGRKRLADLAAELDRVSWLREQATSLAPELAGSP